MAELAGKADSPVHGEIATVVENTPDIGWDNLKGNDSLTKMVGEQRASTEGKPEQKDPEGSGGTKGNQAQGSEKQEAAAEKNDGEKAGDSPAEYSIGDITNPKGDVVIPAAKYGEDDLKTALYVYHNQEAFNKANTEKAQEVARVAKANGHMLGFLSLIKQDGLDEKGGIIPGSKLDDYREYVETTFGKDSLKGLDEALKFDPAKFQDPIAEQLEAVQNEIARRDAAEDLNKQIEQLKKDHKGITELQVAEVVKHCNKLFDEQGIFYPLEYACINGKFNEKVKTAEQIKERQVINPPSGSGGAQQIQKAPSGASGWQQLELGEFADKLTGS